MMSLNGSCCFFIVISSVCVNDVLIFKASDAFVCLNKVIIPNYNDDFPGGQLDIWQ